MMESSAPSLGMSLLATRVVAGSSLVPRPLPSILSIAVQKSVLQVIES